MKKVLLGVTAAALAAVMCASFVACGEGNGSDEIPNAESFVSEKVTAEQWKAAFAEENFKNVKVTMVESYEEGSKEDGTWGQYLMIRYYSCDGNKGHIERENIVEGIFAEENEDNDDDDDDEGEYENDTYTLYADGVVTFYEKKKSEANWEEADSYQPESEYTYLGATLVGVELFIADYFNDFKYNEEAKGYVLKDNVESDLNVGNAILKFQSGKLFAVIWTTQEEGHISFYAYTYGGQKVTLPKISK